MADVVKLAARGTPEHIKAGDLCTAILDVIYGLEHAVALATAVGALELAKLELIADHQEDD